MDLALGLMFQLWMSGPCVSWQSSNHRRQEYRADLAWRARQRSISCVGLVLSPVIMPCALVSWRLCL